MQKKKQSKIFSLPAPCQSLGPFKARILEPVYVFKFVNVEKFVHIFSKLKNNGIEFWKLLT